MNQTEIFLPKQIELETGEALVLLTRQHWYVFRDSILISLFIPFLMLSAVFFLDFSNLPARFKDNFNQLFLIAAAVSFLIGLTLFLWRLYLWSRTFYLVTNKRLIMFTQYGFFHSDDRECSLSMIQDVRAEVKGLQASLYGFGDVIVQVSAQFAQIKLEKVGHPHQVQKTIMKEAHLR